jgi:hypothetical protein
MTSDVYTDDQRNEIARHQIFIRALQDDSILDEATFNTPAMLQEHKNERNFLLRADVELRQVVPIEDMRKAMTELMDRIAESTGIDEAIQHGFTKKAYEMQINIQEQQHILGCFCSELKEFYGDMGK